MRGLGRVVCVLLILSVSIFAHTNPQTNPATPTRFPGQTATPVPRVVKFSGTIAGTHGTVGITFALYNEQTGGAPLWQEIQNVTPDANGRYTIYLGANHAEGVPLDMFASGEARWLGVQAEGQAEQPRVMLASAPYALASGDAQTLGGKPLSAFVLAGTVTGVGNDGLNYVNTEAVRSASAGLVTPLVTSGTAGYLGMFVDSSSLGNSAAYQSGSSIGINTTSPQAALHVVSSSTPAGIVDVYSNTLNAVTFVTRAARGTPASPAAVQAGDIIGGFTGRGWGTTGFSGGRGALIIHANEAWSDTAQSTYIQFNTTPLGQAYQTERMRIDNAGNVGIGTTSPGQKLEVNGSIKLSPGSGSLIFADGTEQATAAVGVSSFNGRRGAVLPLSGDYSFAQIGSVATLEQLPATVLNSGGSYADPSWLTSLSGSKITGINGNADIQVLLARITALENGMPYLQNGLAPGSAFWAKALGSKDGAAGTAVGADGNGNVYIAGTFAGSLDFGGGLLNSSGTSTIFLAKYTADGSYVWSKCFGGSPNDSVTNMAVDAGGNVYLTGVFSGSVIDLGGGALTNAGEADVFLAKFDTNGNHKWSKGFGGARTDRGEGIAVGSDGSVYLAGRFSSPTIDFGGGPLTNLGTANVFVAKFDTQGTHQWSRCFGGTGEDAAQRVAVDNTGLVYVTGTFSSLSIDFDGAVLSNCGSGAIFLVKLSLYGTIMWAKRFCATVAGAPYGLVADAGIVYLTGAFRGSSIDFGGGPLYNGGVASYDIFLASFNSSGYHMWSKSFQGAGSDDYAYSIAMDSERNAYITGFFSSSTIYFGGGQLANKGNANIFVAKFDVTGAHLWSIRFGGSAVDVAESVAVGPTGALYVTGYTCSSTIDFGGGPLTNAGSDGMFLVKLKQ